MLRHAFPKDLPTIIWRRRKQGFGVPVHDWFRGRLGERLIALANDDRAGPLRPEKIAELLRQHRQGGRDHGNRLWVLYTYLLWKQQHS